MARRERALIDAEHHARAVGNVRRPLAFEIWQEHQAVRTGGNARGLAGEGFVRVFEILPHHLGRHGDVHRAKQGQPAIRRVAERGDLAFGIDDRLFRAGVDRSARAEARGDHAFAGVAGADRTHHVVAAARAHQHVRLQAELLRRGRLQRARRLITRNQAREFRREIGIDGFQHRARPFAFAHIQQGRAAGVAVFHHLLAGEPEVEVVMRQEN